MMDKLTSKKGLVGDFLVLAWIGLAIIVLFGVMSLLAWRMSADFEAPEGFEQYYTKELVKYLRTSAGSLDPLFDGMTFAELIADDISILDEKVFAEYTRDFVVRICAQHHDEQNHCALRITNKECLASRVGSISGFSRGSAEGMRQCIVQIPDNSAVKTLSAYEFPGPGGEMYEIQLVAG